MWANERAEATLFDLLTLVCFTSPPAIGVIEGKAAGPVGILIGILVGLGAGGLAAYTLRLTAEYEYSCRLDEKRRPQIVKMIFETDLFFIFIAVVIGAAVGLTKIITMNIVPHVAF